MSLEYAPSPITLIQAAPLSVAFVQASPNRLGGVAAPRWWNHADGGYEAAYDPAKHLRPLERVDVDPESPNYQFQWFGVPMDAIDPTDVQAFIYRLTTPELTEPHLVYSRSHLGYFSGA